MVKSDSNNPSDKQTDKNTTSEGVDTANLTPDQVIDNKINDEINALKNIKIDLIKKISSEKDTTTKGKGKSLNKIYPYWAIIFKDNKKYNSFGVREETINDVKLLVRTEKVDNETKVVFLQLFPEPKFDVNVISQNKTQIAKELNKLKQIARKLEKERYEAKMKSYNHDISDINILIKQKEIELESIKYGKSFSYTHDIRDDGIPTLMYDFENGGLKLRKYVKEKSMFTQASELKILEDREVEKDINIHLRKKNDTNYAKLGTWLLVIFLLCAGSYGVFELLDYNAEREFGEIHDKIERTMIMYDNSLKTLIASCGTAQKPLLDSINSLVVSNRDILDSCVNNNLIDNIKPTIED